MEVSFAHQLMAILERSSFGELEFKDGEDVVRLSKIGRAPSRHPGPNGDPVGDVAPVSRNGVSSLLEGEVARPMPARPAPASRVVRAGIPGIFYSRPSPDAPPFVAVGQRVQEGAVLGIIEAMKMLNPVESPLDGRIAEIKAAEGAGVGAGDELFVIEEIADADV